MNDKRTVYQVSVNGKEYRVGGVEDPQKIRRISDVLAQKQTQLGGLRKYNHETKAAMMQINLAEDLVDMNDKYNEKLIESEKLEQEIYELKQELIAVRMENEKMLAADELLKKEKEELQLKVARLESGGNRSSRSNSKN